MNVTTINNNSNRITSILWPLLTHFGRRGGYTAVSMLPQLENVGIQKKWTKCTIKRGLKRTHIYIIYIYGVHIHYKYIHI